MSIPDQAAYHRGYAAGRRRVSGPVLNVGDIIGVFRRSDNAVSVQFSSLDDACKFEAALRAGQSAPAAAVAAAVADSQIETIDATEDVKS